MSEWKEFSGKNVDEALTEALISLETTSDKVEWEVIEKESNGILGIFSKKEAKIRVKLKNNPESNAKRFLGEVFEAMQLSVNIDVDYNEEEETMDIDIKGDDLGILIGKRGQTLDSLQYLTSLVVNKEAKGYIKVKLDTENYRERRKETLENLARNIAYKVKKTRRKVVLEPMNPYERRIIHSALQSDKYVETHSEGEEPYRKVVVTLKYDSHGYNNRNKRNNRGGYNKYNNKNSSYQKETNEDGNKEEE